MKKLFITIDVEQDCPPMLSSMHGIKDGLPKLLKIFKQEEVKATFLVTGAVAQFHPRSIEGIIEKGHELGCHGYAHERFDRLSPKEARNVIDKALEILREFDGDIVSFRAPNLKFPTQYLDFLEGQGFLIDSSLAKYKPPFPRRSSKVGHMIRVPVSVTSSFLRLPLPLVLPVLRKVQNPVLFAHPWEFMDMSKTPVRFDCRFNTGEGALRNLSAIIRHFKSENYAFLPLKTMIS
ncbi:MAG: polysaccharide deacetylase family protein [Deltaproteobacteria bacterium]|jgi:peptidoglycan/xylan/chitin deacetylase (PgdA/CDA1 family)